MGLLDWLTDLGGSDMMGNLSQGGGVPTPEQAGNPMHWPSNSPASVGITPPMPPVQPNDTDYRPSPPMVDPNRGPPLAAPDGGNLPNPPPNNRPMPPVQGLDNAGPSQVQMLGQDAPPLPPGQQGNPSIPLPRPRPAAADAAPPMPPTGPAAIPPNATPTIGAGSPPLDVPGAVRSYQAAGGNLNPPPAPAPGQQGGGIGGFSLSHALGLNISDAQRGALAAGLKSVGENSTKPGLAAFSGSLGSGMEGAKATTDKTYDQKIKYLQASVAAQQAGDKAEYNRNYAAYLSGKLKADTEKAASADAGTGKKGAWNKPDSQKFIDAQHALASDPEVKASQKLLEQMAKTAEPTEIAKAQAAHTALIKQKEAGYLSGVGLNPQQVQKNLQTPPGAPQNPHVVTSQQDFDQYVKPGDAYVNPKDGKTYIRKGKESGKGESASPGNTISSEPLREEHRSPPAPPGPAPGIKTDDED
jgi:hypothetical protein